MLVDQHIDWAPAGGFVAIPQQFQINMIIGFSDFTTSKTDTTITFILNITTINGAFGINATNLAVRNPRYVLLARGGFTLFYLKTWSCPAATSFNKLTNMCESCNVANCLACSSQDFCNSC